MKFIARTVVLLLIVNTLLIYMHYKQAGDVIAKDTSKPAYQQEIEVMNRLDALYVRHHFSGLSPGRHEIIWPEASIERACYATEVTSCGRLDASLTAFVDGDNPKQSISYKIPKTVKMQQAVLFNEPFVTLQGATVSSTQLHITDEIKTGGMWVTGLKQIGAKKMDLIDYTYFQDTGGIQDLYWQRNSLPILYEGEKLAVYGVTGNAEQFKGVDETLEMIKADHSTIVIDQANIAVQSRRFIVSESADADKVADLFLTSAMFAQFSIPPQQRLVAEIMASILGERAIGTEQSRKSYDKLIAALTAEELARLKELASSKVGQEVNASILDDFFVEVTGFKTSYFKTAIAKETANHPFLFEDIREVQIDDEHYPDIAVILKDGKTLYPAETILSQMGYSIRTNEQSIYIESDARQLRFPKKELFYVSNERKFDVREVPFEVVAGDIYFEESWFKRIFLLTINKTVDTINIVNLSKVLEEVAE